MRTLTAGRLLAVRLRAGWPAYVPIWLGFAVAVALVTAFPEAAQLAAGAGLRSTIAVLGADGDVVVTRTFTLDANSYLTLSEGTRKAVRDRLGTLLTPAGGFLLSRTYEVSSRNGKSERVGREPSGAVLQLAAYDRLADHAELLTGAWPGASTIAGDYPVALSQAAATRLGAKLGDRLCLNSGSGDDAFCVRVVGTWKARDPVEPYWGGNPGGPLTAALEQPLYFAIVNGKGLSAAQAVSVFVPDLAAINATDPAQATDQLGGLRAAFGNDPSTAVATQLDATVQDYSERMRVGGFALQFVAAQLWLLALFCAAFLVSLKLDQDRQSIAVWRTRGWARAGISLLLAEELLVVAFLALPVGAVAGWLAGWAGVRVAYPDVARPALSASGTSAVWGALVLAMAVGAGLIVSQAVLAARGGVLRARVDASRPARSRWRSPAAGVVALLVGMALLAESQSLGSARLREAGGGGLPFDLLLPGLGIALVAFAGVRLLPVAGRLGEAAARGVEQRLAGLQLRRSPARQEDLALLLAATVAVGVFASTFASTSVRNAGDRAAYAAGADLRTAIRGTTPVDLDTLPSTGLAARSQVFRSYASAGSAGPEGQLLGVDPSTFGGVAWTRPDLLPVPLPRLLAALAAREQGGVVLPATATGLSIQVYGAGTGGRLVADLTDTDGRAVRADFGSLDFSGWRELRATLTAVTGATRPPLRFRRLTFLPVSREGKVAVARLAATVPGGSPTSLEDFDYDPNAGFRAFPWWESDGDRGFKLQTILPNADRLLDGHTSASVFLSPGYLPVSLTPSYQRFSTGPGYTHQEYLPVPAIVSSSVLKRLKLKIGDTVPLRVDTAGLSALVVAAVDYFPTLYANAGDFFVLSLQPLLAELGEDGHQRPWPDELWAAALAGGSDRAAAALRARPEVAAVYGAGELRGQALSDPLLLGARINLALGFLAALALAVAGFAIHFVVVGRSRVTEYAILRANGMSAAQVRGTLGVEQLLLLAFSALLGLGVGALASLVLLPSLQVGTAFSDTVPPTLISVEWAPLGVALLAVIGGCLLAGRIGARAAAGGRLMSELRALG